MPYFSIITINLNNAKGLQKTINSVLSQDYKNFEYIVIDGSSTDGSVEVIKKYSEQLAYWISEKDSGIYEAMNKGIAVSKGEYCLFLNSGDYLYQNDVFQKVSESNSSADIIYGDLMTERDGMMVSKITSPDKVSKLFLLVNVVVHPAQFIKRSLFKRFGNYSTVYRIGSDYEFFLRLFFKTKLSLHHIPIPISVFDLSGISNNPVHEARNFEEKKSIQKLYYPKIIISMYYAYDAFMRSCRMNNSWLLVPLRYLNKLVLKIFKANEE